MDMGVFANYPFEPNVVLPSQFFSLPAKKINSPELRLIFAVLEDELKMYLKYRGTSSRRACRLTWETEEWFRSTDTIWLYSFEAICEVLDLEASAIREQLFQKNSRCTRPKSQPIPRG